MTLWAGGAEAWHTQIDDIRLDLAELIIGQANAPNHINAEIVKHGIDFRYQVVENPLTIRMFKIDRE